MVNKAFMNQARKWMNRDVDLKAIEADRKRRDKERKANVVVPEEQLKKQTENNLLNLESKVDFSKNISNEIVLEADGQRVKYIGYAEKLHFDGNAIRGRARLRRYDLKEKIRTKKKRISWFPPRTKVEEERSEKGIKRWEVISGEYAHDFFVYAGRSRAEYNGKNGGYIAGLKSAAVNLGIDLSPELFEAVFGPIDKKIMEMYRKFYRKEDGK